MSMSKGFSTAQMMNEGFQFTQKKHKKGFQFKFKRFYLKMQTEEGLGSSATISLLKVFFHIKMVLVLSPC